MAGCSWVSRAAFACVLALMSVGVGGVVDSDEADYVTLSSSECIAKQTQIVLRLSCSKGQMVRLLRIFLGNSTRGTCEYSRGDCTMDLPSTENYPCIGTEFCRISMLSANLGRQIPKCREASTYVEALYQCIPGSDSVSVCDRSRSLVIGQRGFVRTPGYPLNYPNNMDCNLTLVAPHDDQRLKLFVIDLNLEPNGTACSDWLQVFDGFQSNTLCGQRTRYWLRNSTQRTMHIHFNSDGSRQGKGFWLYYEAFPLMQTAPSTPPSPATASSSSTSAILLLQPPMESNSSSSRTGRLPSAEAVASPSSSSSSSMSSESSSSSSNQVIYVANEASTLPLGVLLAVVITLLICILLILLIIVFIKSRSTGRHLATVTRLPGSDERMDNLEREQRASFYPSSSSPRSSSSFRDSAAGDRMTDPHHEDALLSSAYTPLKKKDVY